MAKMLAQADCPLNADAPHRPSIATHDDAANASARKPETIGSLSAGMSAGLARNWWAVGLRGLAAVLFGFGVLALPSATRASLVLLFVAYVAADGIFAILAGTVAARRGERWQTLILEGATNLALAGAVLVWPAIAVLPLVALTAAWAVITGALLLAAARRLSGPHGHWVLTIAGAASAVWGALEATVGPSAASDPRSIGLWLVGYAVPFGAILLTLGFHLQRRHQMEATSPPSRIS
jgi:uncharacterized membrane protein HdeD (DUF308 family)